MSWGQQQTSPASGQPAQETTARTAGTYRDYLLTRNTNSLLTGYLAGGGEPSAPSLSLGERVVWLQDGGAAELGSVRWIGRLPALHRADWSIGVEFDRPIGTGNGRFAGKQYFIARNGHALFLPILTLMKAEEFFGAHRNATRALETQRFESGDHTRHFDVSRNPCSIKQRTFEQQHAAGASGCPCPLHRAPENSCFSTSGHHGGGTARHKSVTICQTTRGNHHGNQDWSNEGFPFQSWKSSQSVVSCPAALGPGTILMEVTSDSSDSDPGAGKFKTLMACFLPGSSRRKKNKKKKKLKKFVLAQQQRQYSLMVDGTPLRTSESCAAFQGSSCHLHACQEPKRNVSCSDVFNTPKFQPAKVTNEKITKVGFVDAPLKKTKAPPPPRPVSPLAPLSTNRSSVKPSAPTIHNFNSLPGKSLATATKPSQNTLPARALQTKEDPSYTGNLVLIGNQRPQIKFHQSTSSLQVPKSTFVSERTSISPHPRRRNTKKRAPLPPTPDDIRGGLTFSSPDSTRSSSRSGDNANFLDASTDDDRVDSPSRPALPKKTISHDSLTLFGYSQDSLKKKDFEDLRLKEADSKPGCSSSTTTISSVSQVNAQTEVETQERTNISSTPRVIKCSDLLSGRKESNRRSVSPKVTQKESKECQTLDLPKNPLLSISKEIPDSSKKFEGSTKSKKKSKKFEASPKEQNQVKEILTEIEKVVKSKPTVKDFVTAFTKFTEKAEKIAADYYTETANLNSKPEPPKKIAVKTVVKVEDPPSLKSHPTKWTFNQSESKLNISFTEADRLLKQDHEDKITNRKKSLKKHSAPPVPNVTVTQVVTSPAGERNNLDARNSGSIWLTPGVSGAPFSQTRAALRQLSAFQLQHRMAMSVQDLSSDNDHIADRWQHRPRTPGAQPKFLNGPACTGKPPLPLRALELSGGCPALFLQLEEAIASGQHKRAAALAREMALHKVLQARPRPSTLRNATPTSPMQGRKPHEEQFVTVSLYVEDKDTHQGPIPLTVYPSMTVSVLKEKVWRELGFLPRCQRWILGRTFVVDEQRTLVSLDVASPGCPIFLYIVQPRRQDEEDEEEEEERGRRDKGNPPAAPSSPSRADVLETLLEETADYGLTKSKEVAALEADCSSSNNSGGVQSVEVESVSASLETADLSDDDVDIADVISTSLTTEHSRESSGPVSSEEGSIPEERPVFSRASQARLSYDQLLALEDQDLISNTESFECPVCFSLVQSGQGAVLRDCLHLFCRECLSRSVEYCEDAVIKCPFRNDDYSCDSHLLEREIKTLVSAELFEKHLQRSMKAAESRAENSFHCKTADCPGWCLFEDNVNVFACPVCAHVNCLTCAAIHEGKDCKQYQDELQFDAEQSEDAKMTKDYLDSMVSEGKAMRCPTCRVIVMKKWGCDWLKCSVCHTEICWVTKGPRWGPAGRGDTSGGCKCMLDKVRCHLQCNYCH